jgi:hypothetical protein
MIFWRRLGSQGSTHQFSIEHSPQSGWIAREQHDTSIHTNLIHDWRRVELAMVIFELKASELRRQGWSDRGA